MQDTYLYNDQVILRFDSKRHKYTVIDLARSEDEFKVPSVTTVLGVISKGDALVQWAANQVTACINEKLFLYCTCGGAGAECACVYTQAKIAEIAEDCRNAFKRKKQDAADVGTEAHNLIEGIVNTEITRDKCEGSSGSPFEIQLRPEDIRVAHCVDAATDWLQSKQVVPLLAERRIYSRKHRFSGTADLIARVDGRLALIDWKSSKGLYREYEFQTASYAKAYEEETGNKIETRWLIRLGKEDGAFEPKELTDLRGDYAGFLAALRLYRALQK